MGYTRQDFILMTQIYQSLILSNFCKQIFYGIRLNMIKSNNHVKITSTIKTEFSNFETVSFLVKEKNTYKDKLKKHIFRTLMQ